MQRVLDATAVGLSGLCIAHCLALPVAAAALPMLGALAGAEWVHWAFVAIAAPVAVLAIAPVMARRPIPWPIPLLALAGLLLLATGASALVTEDWGRVLTIIGGATLAIAHILNWRRGAHHPPCAGPVAGETANAQSSAHARRG